MSIIKRRYKQLKSSDIKPLKVKILESMDYTCPITKQKLPEDYFSLDHKHKDRKHDIPDINNDGCGLIRTPLSYGANIMEGKIWNIFHMSGLANEGLHLPTILRNMADFYEKYEENQEYYKDEDGFYYIHPTEKIPEKKLQKSSYDKLVKELKKAKFKNKIPEYPKSQMLTQALDKLYNLVDLEPVFYK